MAKRFTDTDKWKKTWFRKLGPKVQHIWNYLCDSCDHAGIWEVDLGLLEFQTGVKISLEEIAAVFRGKVHVFDHGSKLWVIPFFDFQYGESKAEFKARISALKRLQKFNLADDAGYPLVTVTQDLEKTPGTVLDSPSIGIGKGKGISKKGGPGENKFDFESLYSKYPRKEGKAAGLIQCRKQILTQETFDALSGAIDRYAAHCRATDQIVKHFSSFMGSEKTGYPWQEWTDPGTGAGAIPAGKGGLLQPVDLSEIFKDGPHP